MGHEPAEATGCEELETIQAARKAREESVASMDAEPAKQPAEPNEGYPEKQGENPASSDSHAFEGPEDGVRKVGWHSMSSSLGLLPEYCGAQRPHLRSEHLKAA